MPTTGAQRTITFELDWRIALEALVLNRLSKTPLNRQIDWLRGLVVSGFQRECETLKSAQGDHFSSTTEENTMASRPHHLRNAYVLGLAAGRLSDKQPRTKCLLPASNPPLKQRGQAENTAKPFANLRQVIG